MATKGSQKVLFNGSFVVTCVFHLLYYLLLYLLFKFHSANALQSMKSGSGPEVSIVARSGGKSVEELTSKYLLYIEQLKGDL